MTKRWLATAILLWLTVGCASDDTDSAADDTTTTEVEDVGAPVASAGCGTSVAEPGVEVEHTLNVRGAERRYLLTTPSAHDGETPLPVVLDFHGLMEGAEVHAGMSQWSALAEEEGVVAVFPHGTGDPIRWDVELDDEENDDLAYFDAVVAELGESLCIDESPRLRDRPLQRGDDDLGAAVRPGRRDRGGRAGRRGERPGGLRPRPPRPAGDLPRHRRSDPALQRRGRHVGHPRRGDEDAGGTTTPPPADLDGEGYPAAAAAFADRNGCDREPTDTEISDEVTHRVYECPEGPTSSSTSSSAAATRGRAATSAGHRRHRRTHHLRHRRHRATPGSSSSSSIL